MSRGFCSEQQIADCPFASHFSDIHHAYFPRTSYVTRLEKTFRELPENKERLCRNEHNELHATSEIPEKPDKEFMLRAISRVLRGERMTA
jgi:hypothetical protein